MTEQTNQGGRPLKFKTVEELEKAIEEFFTECDNYEQDVFVPKLGKQIRVKTGKPYTITGMALALDTTRETLLDYESGQHDDKAKDAETNRKFSDIVKRAKLRCHEYVERQLLSGGQAAGPIFNLKNNYGWRDKTEHEHSGPDAGPITFVNKVPRPAPTSEEGPPQQPPQTPTPATPPPSG